MKDEPLETATSPDTTLVKLKLARHDELHWEGRLEKILSNFTSIKIPDPQAFLQDPLSSAPQLLMVYRNTPFIEFQSLFWAVPQLKIQ
jgi:hypothetical protein